jgi:hypothetical protein
VIIVRIALVLVGIWFCWSAVTIKQVQKQDGVRVLPIWSRVLMALGGLVCVWVAFFGDSTSSRYSN